MIANNPIGRTAVKDFLIKGMPLTSLEGGVLFGCTGVHRVVSDLRRAGFRIDTRKVSYALALRRINAIAQLTPPTDLPIREIFLTEYRVKN